MRTRTFFIQIEAPMHLIGPHFAEDLEDLIRKGLCLYDGEALANACAVSTVEFQKKEVPISKNTGLDDHFDDSYYE